MSTNIDQHMKLTKKQRQSHIDLTSPCIPSVLKINSKLCKIGDYTSRSAGKANAKNALLDFHQIEDFKIINVHTCHLCVNSSAAPNGFVCTNPYHLYFGSSKENNNDIDPNGNPTGGVKGGKAPSSDKQKKVAAKTGAKNAKESIKRGNHVTQQTNTCPHCSFQSTGPVMKRWHFDNCRHK